MNKSDYLYYRKINPMKVIYEFYKEKFDTKKHKTFLSEGEFYTYIQANYDINSLYTQVTKYYDNHFSVITIMDDKGNILSFC